MSVTFLDNKDKEELLANIGALSKEIANISGEAIPDYWEDHLAEKIGRIKELQRAGGKDCYSFVVITDVHYYDNIGKRSPNLIKKIMDDCNIKFCLCLGDMQNGGAWKTKELELAEWDEIDKMFRPINDRTLMIPGNHDGAYGSADMNGDGVISGATDYYIYNLAPDEVYDLVCRKVSLINGVKFDAEKFGYYVDEPVSKVRYILINTHYSDGAVNADGTAVNNYMRKIRVGQSQVDMLIDALKSIPDDGWNVVVGMHIPLAQIADSGPSGDMVLLRDVLEAYQSKTTYSNTFGTAGEYDYVSVDVDFAQAEGSVLGVFCGHVHRDACNTDYAFPIITSISDNTVTVKVGEGVVSGEAGTITEQSFDVITVDRGAGLIHATKVGCGYDRTFGAMQTFTNLADRTSPDWFNDAGYTDGTINENAGTDFFVSNFIPVTQFDVLRYRVGGEDLRAKDKGYKAKPAILIYDESKQYLNTMQMTENGTNSLFPILEPDENGVFTYTILLRGSTGEQFTLYNTRVKYIRLFAPMSDDVIITVNEEIV